MMGNLVYRLRAKKSARLPLFHGRLLHGLVFHLLQAYSPEMATFIHDKLNYKPFTVSLLWQHKHLPSKRQKESFFTIQEGETYFWRVTVLQENLLQALLALPTGALLPVGKAVLELQEFIVDGRYHTGVVDENELIAGALAIPAVQTLTLKFTSPVSFRYFNQDYPFPLPKLVFGSLADKWMRLEMPASIDREAVRKAAENVIPLEWQGNSHKVYFGQDRGMLAFSGTFRYDVSHLSQEMQQTFLLLVQFAEFAGTGRLAAQGFGQTRFASIH